MKRRYRSRYARAGNEQEAVTQLDGVARVSAAAFQNLPSNLRAHVGELAASLPLHRAIVAHDESSIRAFAHNHRVRIDVDGHSYGRLALRPRIAGSATIAAGGRVLARVTSAVPIDKRLVEAVENATPTPAHAALLFVRHGRVIAGGPAGAKTEMRNGRLRLASVSFQASAAQVARNLNVLAIEPQSAIDARITPYRRRLFLIAALTLALAAGVRGTIPLAAGTPLPHPAP